MGKSFTHSFLLLLILLQITSLEGATTWTGVVDDDFGDSGNWNNGVPNVTNDGTIDGLFTVTYNADSELDDVVINIDGGASLSGDDLSLNNTNLSLTGASYITVNGDFRIGQDSGGGGAVVDISGTSIFTVTGRALLGIQESASFSQSGSSVVNVQGGFLDIGNSASSGSAYIINGGTLNALDRIRIQHASSFTLNNGVVNGAENFVVRDLSTFNMFGGELNVGDNFNINTTGGSVNILGGEVNVGNNLNVQGVDSSLNLLDGNIVVSNNLQFSVDGGTGNLSGGTIDVGNQFRVTGAGSVANIAGSDVKTDNLTVITDGILNVDSGSFEITNNAILRNGGSVEQNIDITINNDLRIDSLVASTTTGSSFNANIGTLEVGRDLRVEDDSVFNQTGSDVIVERDLRVNDNAVYHLDSGILQVGLDIEVDNTASFLWDTGGILQTHDSVSSISYIGDLTASGGTLNLDAETEFLDVSGMFDVDDLIIDGYSLTIARTGAFQSGFEILVDTANLTGNLNDIEYTNFSVFAGLDMLSLVNDPLTTTLDEYYYFDTTGNQVRLQWVIVPEPTSTFLLLIGSGMCLSLRQRKPL
ncbi:PEP-CTERM sorting domain-containing protein [Akkermansiaceae bacterium]|nr:PEP-CTERM sorting domain-containing protein [Akkermansiaceae bacterium]